MSALESDREQVNDQVMNLNVERRHPGDLMLQIFSAHRRC